MRPSEEGLLISGGPRAGFTPGSALIRLAAAAIIDTERLARPVLQDVSAEIGETVDLSVLQGGQAVFVDQVVGTSRLVAISAVGEAFPLHCNAKTKRHRGQIGQSASRSDQPDPGTAACHRYRGHGTMLPKGRSYRVERP